MKPAARFLLLGLASALFLAIVVASGVIWETHKLAHDRLLDHLQAAGNAEAVLRADRFRELQLRAETLANDPSFVDYIAQSLIPDPKLGGLVDSVSISDLLSERRHGFDIAIILDPKGKSAAASGALLKDDSSIAHEPAVIAVLATHKSTQGLWADHGQLVIFVANPLLKGGVLQGVLLAGSRLDDRFANDIAKVAGTGIALFVPSKTGLQVSFSSGLGAWVGRALDARMQQVIDVKTMAGQELILSDGQRDRTTWVWPMEASGSHAALLALDPDASSDKLIQDSAMPMLYLVLGLWLIGSVFVWWQWSRIYVPLQGMMDIIGRAAQGDHFLNLPTVQSAPIVRNLRDVINRLLTQSRM
jgi:hypothetical protein